MMFTSYIVPQPPLVSVTCAAQCAVQLRIATSDAKRDVAHLHILHSIYAPSQLIFKLLLW